MNKSTVSILFISCLMICFSSMAFSENSFERELVVKDQTRTMKVEAVFKELIKAYEDEDARGFLGLVSDERFRQDYITFTDALYSDFRTYDIHRVDYWIDRVVPDNIKQFLYVKWEKRYETLDNGRQNTIRGYSRFLFDEVNGKYLLVELAGNSLFGGSLREWNNELPRISGSISSKEPAQKPDETPCAPGAVSGCTVANCESNGGYWYNNQCNSTPPDVVDPDPTCDGSNLYLCNVTNCAAAGGFWYNNTCNAQSEQDSCTGYWSNNTCYASEEEACTANSMYWYNNQCNADPEPAGLPDLEITDFGSTQNVSGQFLIHYTVTNSGTAPTLIPTDLIWQSISGPPGSEVIPALAAGQSYSNDVVSDFEPFDRVEVDTDLQITESNENNNMLKIIPQ